jgi:hypothetical protein
MCAISIAFSAVPHLYSTLSPRRSKQIMTGRMNDQMDGRMDDKIDG